MKLAVLAIVFAVPAVASPASAANCPAEAAVRANSRWAPAGGIPERDVNMVFVGPGTELRWNGAETTEREVATYLELVDQRVPTPTTLLGIYKDADCALLSRVVTAIEAHADANCVLECGFELAVPQSPPPRRRR